MSPTAAVAAEEKGGAISLLDDDEDDDAGVDDDFDDDDLDSGVEEEDEEEEDDENKDDVDDDQEDRKMAAWAGPPANSTRSSTSRGWLARAAAVPPPPPPPPPVPTSSRQKKKNASGSIIDLCGDDGSGGDQKKNKKKAKVATAGPKPATMAGATTTTKKGQPKNDDDEGPINLCDSSSSSDDDDDDDCNVIAEPIVAAAIPPAARKKRKRPAVTKASAAAVADAIVLFDTTSPERANGRSCTMMKEPPLSADEQYRRALGPMRMEFVVGAFQPSAHAFQTSPAPSRLARTLSSELIEYQLNLPVAAHSSIFVRVQESRMDLLRVLITGPVDTPYQHGIYLFDVHLHRYPATAPKVKFLTTDNGRVRFNPNLYNCGKVCLSLLGTWSGPGWISGQSTLLQVLISIQALILVPEPYYNEPGYETQRHMPRVRKASAQYSTNIRRHNLSVAILQPLQQVLAGRYIYPEFADVVRQHFIQQSEHLRQQLHEWVQTEKSLQSIVTSIEQQLDQLQQQQQQQLLLLQAPPPVGPPETIDLLDDD